MDNDPQRRLPGTDLLSGITATAALGALTAGLHFPIVVAAGVAVAVYGGMRLLLTPRRAAGDDDLTASSIARGRKQVARLREISGTIAKPAVRASVNHICAMAEQIFAMFAADPSKALLARGFVDYTLSRTLTVVSRYCDLSSRSMSSAAPTLARAESLLTTIEASFGEQIEKLLKEDVADLDSEIEVLQTRLDLEGDLSE